MLQKGTAKKVTIYVNEDTRHHLGPLYESILTFLLHKGVAGATATRAMAGFGAHHTMHTPKIEVLSEHLPVRIEFIETAERVDELLPALYDMVSDGVIEVQDTAVVKAARKDRPEPKPPHAERRGKARLMHIYLNESTQWQGKPLYEAVVERSRQMGISGATVFRGLEGYGETAALHRKHLMRHDQPIVITILDTAENLDRLIPEVEAMMDTGLITTSEVDFIRIERPPAA